MTLDWMKPLQTVSGVKVAEVHQLPQWANSLEYVVLVKLENGRLHWYTPDGYLVAGQQHWLNIVSCQTDAPSCTQSDIGSPSR